MTGEKIRSLRKDHRPRQDEDLLEPDEEAATGTFAVPKANKSRAGKIFSNHRLIKSPSQVNANSNTEPSTTTTEVIDDNNKNPIVRTGLDYPVHECVFKGDVRRLSSLIRTQNIAQKDVHGESSTGFSHYSWDLVVSQWVISWFGSSSRPLKLGLLPKLRPGSLSAHFSSRPSIKVLRFLKLYFQ